MEPRSFGIGEKTGEILLSILSGSIHQTSLFPHSDIRLNNPTTGSFSHPGTTANTGKPR